MTKGILCPVCNQHTVEKRYIVENDTYLYECSQCGARSIADGIAPQPVNTWRAGSDNWYVSKACEHAKLILQCRVEMEPYHMSKATITLTTKKDKRVLFSIADEGKDHYIGMSVLLKPENVEEALQEIRKKFARAGYNVVVSDNRKEAK